ncbi:MAG: multicopper oxidase domain-containing protein [Candidatus Korobacteraceae bacterium]
MSSRRTFLRQSSLFAGGMLLRGSQAASAMMMPHAMPTQPNTLNVSTLPTFVDPLPIPSVAKPDGMRALPSSPKSKAPYYRFAARPVAMKIHRDLKPTHFWSFGPSVPGPTLEMRTGEDVLVEWANQLPQQHFLPIDYRLHGAEGNPQVRIVSHLHGARVPADSDGFPEDWFVPGKSALYHYPNQQDAATLWYHDHAMGINRLNIYAGLFGVAIIRDKFEDGLNLPSGKYEIPLAIFDRLITPDGQLYYPISDKPRAPWVPEVFGDAVLINGKLFPYLEVEPRKYRFRILNGSNSRFYYLAFQNGLPIHQIGTDQGLLPAPATLKATQLAPGERADVVIDFSDSRGELLVLKNDQIGIMQFRVSQNKVSDTSSLPKELRPVPKIPESDATKTRLLTLDEYRSLAGQPVLLLLNGSYWHDPITEKPTLNSTEIWSFINPTDDTHPIHLHAVRFQILDRQHYEPWTYQTKQEFRFLGPRVPPDPFEAGWKDTAAAHSKMVTRIIVPFNAYAGKYVWHCHILEHEDNEMMRPYEIVAG